MIQRDADDDRGGAKGGVEQRVAPTKARAALAGGGRERTPEHKGNGK